jgi:hypothetical protein
MCVDIAAVLKEELDATRCDDISVGTRNGRDGGDGDTPREQRRDTSTLYRGKATEGPEVGSSLAPAICTDGDI